MKSPINTRQTVLYCLFVGMNVSLKEYIIVGRRRLFRTHEELIDFASRIRGKRAEFRLASRVLAGLSVSNHSPN